MAFQRRTWAVERTCWVIMGAVLVTALAGGFSVGPVSTVEATDESGLIYIQYERFLRNLASSTLRVSLAPEATSRSTATIRLSGALASEVKVDKVVPEPVETRLTHDGLEFVFAFADPGKPALIAFHLQPETVGRIAGAVGVSGVKPARINSFVYP